MKKILIVGGGGYLGTVITKQLLNQKHNVKVIDNFMYQDCYISDFPSNFDKVEKVKKDSSKIEPSDLEGVEACFFLSALSNNPIDNINPKKAYDDTKAYTLRVAKMCKEKKIQFIFPSSCSVYGKNDSKFVDEKSKVNPLTFYSINKHEIEIELLKIADDKFKPIMLRIATVLGFSEMMRFDLYINMFVGMLLTTNKIVLNSDGSAWRPNVDINDVAKVFVGLLNENVQEPLILNVGNDQNTLRVIDVVNILKNQNPNLIVETLNESSSFKNVKDDIIKNNKDERSYKVSFTKIKKNFPNLLPKTNIKDAITNLVQNLKQKKISIEKFNSNKFYRLQRLKYLIENKLYP
jgi:nucleoside-diphosphate-sugar epimerase